jgi:voltage-gated potassium channel Kch
MNQVGLSPSLGAFLAGVVLADNEYRHQLETDIEPFKGLLLAIFFISVGSGINFRLIQENPQLICSIVISIMVVKWFVLFGLGKLSKISLPDQLLFAFSLSQGGEFAFVLLKVAQEKGVILPAIAQSLTISVAISMFLAPLLIQVYFKWIQPKFSGCPSDRSPDEIDEIGNPVIIAGFGRFGQMVGRLLRGCGIRPTVLDYDADQIEVLRRFGIKAYYGDATQMDLLRSAGAEHARLFIVAIDDASKILELVDSVKKEFPHLKILSRAYDRIHAYELIQRGIQYPYIETSGSALSLGTEALRIMGFSESKALKASQLFKEHNDESIRELAKIYHEADEATFLTHARNWISALEGMLQKDVLNEKSESDQK